MRYYFLVALLSVLPSPAIADTLFRCRMNAVASRDFQFVAEPSWCGPVDSCGAAAAFGVTLFTKPSFDDVSYREFTVSLSRTSPTVRVTSLWFRDEKGKPLSEEFDAQVVSRNDDVVIFIYMNPAGNKMHSYALDLRHKKLVTASVMHGLTSLVTQARTCDCE